MTVGVIGAGPAGLTAAYQLAKSGVAVHVYEAGKNVGGLAQSLHLWNQTVDLGPHRFFSTDRRVNSLWLEIVGREYAMVRRLTRIYYEGKFFHYPLRPLNALTQLGTVESARCLLSYLTERITADKSISHDTFESWVVNRFGRRLFEIFFKTYSEKLWGIPCDALDADFAAQRIKKLDLFQAVLNALRGDKVQTKHATLVDEFAYPLHGTGNVYQKMAEQIERYGGRVLLNTPVRRVLATNGQTQGVELEGGETVRHDEIVSSMPISLLVSRMQDVPEEITRAALSLRFRNTVLVYLNVQSPALFPDQWLYIHSPELKTGRISNFRNWTPSLYGSEESSILAMEYWMNDDDPDWEKGTDYFVPLASGELRATGLAGDTPIIDGHVFKIRRCYPVYRRGYNEALKPVQGYLRTIRGLQAIGRYGAFKYNNQDHSILMGMLAAENVTQNSTHDLWEINTDYESYQEGALITDAGIAPAISD